MLGEHHFQQLAVEPLRTRLDLADVEARLDVEIIGAGAVLEIEIDQASRDAAAGRAAHEQHRRLHRQRRHAHSACRGQKRVDLGLRGAVRGGAFGDAAASAHQLDRIDRLDQEIGDAQLDELPRDALAEPRGDDEDRDRSGKPPRQVLQGGYLVGAGGIEIDQKHRGVGERELLLGPAHRAGDDGQIDLRAAAERGAQRLLEIGVGRDRDDPQASGSRCLRTVRHDVPTRFASFRPEQSRLKDWARRRSRPAGPGTART